MRVGTNLSGVVLVGSPAEIGLAHLTIEELERFAALVAAAERNRIWNQEDWTEYERGIAAAAKAEENEACAKVCEEEGLLWGQRYAAAIRTRGQQ